MKDFKELENMKDKAYDSDIFETFFVGYKCLVREYWKDIKDFEKYDDDRRIAFNIFNMMLESYEYMMFSDCTNNYIRCAFYDAIRNDEKTIKEIIGRFKGVEAN